MMDVFVTDGRLVDHSLSAKPYTDSAFDMPAQCDQVAEKTL